MDTIEFYSTRGTYGIFSNFYRFDITIDGKIWPTTEHYFQAQKFPDQPEVQEKIRRLSSPSDAARAGRTHS
ncbi:7606_t:CDS:2, partial [Acaulospora morrowiae]